MISAFCDFIKIAVKILRIGFLRLENTSDNNAIFQRLQLFSFGTVIPAVEHGNNIGVETVDVALEYFTG